ncbi:PDR/VanB family oxidoreductase [Paeniglutamicibacter cryotolerans]|uniref:Ferredoxin-NADP reductase n=1 Tax=Paeniglutamicibacter cryotolerans TaxID=670079 RepID=A0A839QGV0_9MICC|nr:PDR/VanB family oxidoreductase [Paeniglutamicibacter cryotolerans]MBB2994823.1 ferredoxin-NADP reductase [Paeniglutamicibacter cryotolerans]
MSTTIETTVVPEPQVDLGIADDGFFEVEVAEIRPEADGVLSLHLAHPAGKPLPDWAPGSHIDVLLPNGLLRQYSLCSEAGAGRWRLGVLREAAGRGGSAYVHDDLRPGARIKVREPRNNFTLKPAPEYLFLAGGIGITPILPMLAAAQESGIPWRLVYMGRSRSSMAFLSELEQFGDKVQVHADDEAGLFPLKDLLQAPDAGFHTYVCGPGPLLDFISSLTSAWDDQKRFHFERFVADPAATAPAAGDHEFTVETTEGIEVQVPVGTSILDALAGAGVPVLNSCREGICGTCETTVVSGEIDHRDSLLSEEEREAGETMMICVSRCKGLRMILDL